MPKLFLFKNKKKSGCSNKKTGFVFFLATIWESFPKCVKNQL